MRDGERREGVRATAVRKHLCGGSERSRATAALARRARVGWCIMRRVARRCRGVEWRSGV